VPDIHIERDHTLGLAKARKVALQWAEDAEARLEMECTILEGERSDTVEFTRSGVKGELRVEAHRFTLDARLGFLLGVFSKTIEAEIEKTLDALLVAPPKAPQATPTRPAAKKAAAGPAKKPAKKTP
jgi:putative polyhydroxyalkanoate system protein